MCRHCYSVILNIIIFNYITYKYIYHITYKLNENEPEIKSKYAARAKDRFAFCLDFHRFSHFSHFSHFSCFFHFSRFSRFSAFGHLGSLAFFCAS